MRSSGVIFAHKKNKYWQVFDKKAKGLLQVRI
uniref:Uncharacterized protein n=1 Tax=Anguilla anguilla TaxID=7936 RepID=A0A0E9QCS3_ANGAN